MQDVFYEAFHDELEKIAARKVKTDIALEHPIAVPAAAYLGGHSLTQALSKSRSPWAVPVTFASIAAPYIGAAVAARKWREATGKPLEKAPSWWIRHPVLGTFLTGPVGWGLTAYKTREALRKRKLLKK